MQRKVSWTASAQKRLLEIKTYIETFSEKYAILQTERILDAVSGLELNKFDGRPVPEFLDPTVRQILIDAYRIIYKVINEDEIHILTVWHSSRKLTEFSDIE